ncbi:MAG: YihY/virulence factor BrkB family protein [Chloroflexi bacterium]|nr:YihY/virulence factor BrkB family protein [Chloroflexota bacterium]
MRFIRCFYAGWQENELSVRAAALTYYAVFSVFPLLLLLSSGLGWLLRDPIRQQQAIETFMEMMPRGSEAIVQLLREIAFSHRVPDGVVALSLLWSASGFLRGLLTAIVRIHDAKASRSGLLLRAWSMLLIGLLIPGLLGTLALLSVAVRLVEILPLPGDTAVLKVLAHHLTLFGIASLAFYLMLRVIPTRRSRRLHSALSALLTAGAWAAVNNGFAQYLTTSLNRLNLIYGSITAVIALMLYIYLVNLTILAGAQLNAVLRDLRTCQPAPLPLVERRPPDTQD